MRNVYVVHAVDTEGPLYEGLDACFEQMRELFAVDLKANMSNVMKLRTKEIPLNGKEDAIASFVSEDRIGKYNGTWDQIDKMHDTFMSQSWRNKFKDSRGQPYVVSWFCMDHVGFNYNPRRRAMGYHEIYDYYVRKLSEYSQERDGIYWHYHPASFSGDAHRMGYNYSFSKNIHNEILARRVIDRNWFPVANRPGGHIETYDINTWLEAWIPYDLANQSMRYNDDLDKEEKSGRIPGRYGDWRGAPTEWSIYNPSLYDYRKEGSLKRWISRCLNMKSRHSNLSIEEIRSAFSHAENGNDVFLSYTNHDFRDMVAETEDVIAKIQSVSNEFPEVQYVWCNAVEGMRAALKQERTTLLELDIELINRSVLNVTLKEGVVWGNQPFLAMRTKSGQYFHDNLIVNHDGTWIYSFDHDSLLIDAVDKIGVASNDYAGNTVVYVMDVESGHVVMERHNQDCWLD